MDGQTNVLQIIFALRAARRLARRLNRRQEKGHQNADDRNDN
jgi:hypothetical protein